MSTFLIHLKVYIRRMAPVPLLALITIALTGCFDYIERIVISPSFSGYVDVEYTVPVYPENGHSLIAFLPVEERAINEKYRGLFGDNSIRVSNYSVEESERESPMFPRNRQVRFRVSFEDPEQLESILLGNTTVYRRGSRLYIQRIFPAARSIPEEAGRLPAQYGELSGKSFEQRFLRFTVIYPEYYDFYTNRGAIVRPGINALQVPLDRSINSSSAFYWNMELRARAKEPVTKADQSEM